jgi:hypothetical protein
MKKLLFIFFASVSFAALPPLAQSTREMQAVLSDSRFYDTLGSAEVIKELIRTEKGYLVLTQNYAMRVDVKYGGGDQRRIGPVHFELEFQQPVDLRTGQVKR